MQHDLSGPNEGTSARREVEDVAIEATDELSIAVELVGERKRVLDLGCGEGLLARLLARRECDIVGFDINPAAVEEARKYCTHAGVADLDGASLPELLGEQKFDAVVLGDVLSYLRQPIRLLDGAREVLAEGGFVVATVPNVSHGAIRLSLLDGRFDPDRAGDGLQYYTAKTLDELFVSAGYRLEPLRRLKGPLFAPGAELRRDDFDPAVVAEVERDPESETRSFAVRAFPLSNDGKQRAIAKRFISVNTELSTLATRLEKRELDVARLAATTRDRESELAEARALLNAASDEMQRARATLTEVANASRSSAAMVARAAELEARAKTAEANVAELIERAHHAEIEVARLSERLAARGASDPAARAEVDRAIAQRDEALARLETAQQQAAAEQARLSAEFNANLGKIRQQSGETEYGYAERIVEIEGVLAAREAELTARQAELKTVSETLEAVEASNSAALHKAGMEIGALRNALAERQSQVDAAAKSVSLARSEAGAARADYDALQVAFATLQAESEALQADLLSVRTERDAESAALDAARAELDAERRMREEFVAAGRVALQEQLAEERLRADILAGERDDANEALRAARAENQTLRDERDPSFEELNSERLRSETFLAERDAANEDLRIVRQELTELHVQVRLLDEALMARTKDGEDYRSLVVLADDEIATLRRQFGTVQARLTEEEARAESATASLAAERADAAELRAENATMRTDLERTLADIARLERARDEANEAHERSEKSRIALEAAIAKKHRESELLSARADDATKRFNDLEARFLDQTQALLDQTRAESERTALLIDTVQGSVFWRLKRALRFLRRRA